MIVVKVELHSAVSGLVRELARMHIANKGDLSTTNPNRGDYDVTTLKGRSAFQLGKRKVQRAGVVLNHARLAEHVWNLVAKALKALDYGEPCNSTSTKPTAPTSFASPETTGT